MAFLLLNTLFRLLSFSSDLSQLLLILAMVAINLMVDLMVAMEDMVDLTVVMEVMDMARGRLRLNKGLRIVYFIKHEIFVLKVSSD